MSRSSSPGATRPSKRKPSATPDDAKVHATSPDTAATSLDDRVRQLFQIADAGATSAGQDPVRLAFDGAMIADLWHGRKPSPEPTSEVRKAMTEYKFARAVHRKSGQRPMFSPHAWGARLVLANIVLPPAVARPAPRPRAAATPATHRATNRSHPQRGGAVRHPGVATLSTGRRGRSTAGPSGATGRALRSARGSTATAI